MPLYATHVKLTEEGMEHIKEGAVDAAQAAHWIEEVGGKVIGAYATNGEANFLYITEFPDNKGGWSVGARLAATGHYTADSDELIPLEEWLQLVSKV